MDLLQIQEALDQPVNAAKLVQLELLDPPELMELQAQLEQSGKPVQSVADSILKRSSIKQASF
jgi:hypothetical protein